MPERVSIPFYDLYRLTWNALDWLYPPVCAGCGAEGKTWCDNCQRSAGSISSLTCKICGDFIVHGEVCSGCRTDPPPF